MQQRVHRLASLPNAAFGFAAKAPLRTPARPEVAVGTIGLGRAADATSLLRDVAGFLPISTDREQRAHA